PLPYTTLFRSLSADGDAMCQPITRNRQRNQKRGEAQHCCGGDEKQRDTKKNEDNRQHRESKGFENAQRAQCGTSMLDKRTAKVQSVIQRRERCRAIDFPPQPPREHEIASFRMHGFYTRADGISASL